MLVQNLLLELSKRSLEQRLDKGNAMHYNVNDFMYEETSAPSEDQNTVTDVYESITDEEWELLAKWDRKGKFI